MPYTIRALTPQLRDDFFTFFEHVAFAEHPEWGCDCFCCFFHAATLEAWDAATGATNKETAAALIESGGMRGLLAYDGNKPVGWCHYDTLQNLPGAKLFYGELASDEPEKAAVVCFTIAQGYRGRGIAAQLLKGALSDLRKAGVKQVEAYPAIGNDSQEHNYHGPLSMFLKQGFSVVKETKDHALVEITL